MVLQPLFLQEDRSREPNVLVCTSLMNVREPRPDIISLLNRQVSGNLYAGGFNSIFIENDSSVINVIDSGLFMGAFFVIEIIYIDSEDLKNLCIRAYSTWDKALITEEKNVFSRFDEEAFLVSGMTLPPILREYLNTDEARDLASQLNMVYEKYGEPVVDAGIAAETGLEPGESGAEEVPLSLPPEENLLKIPEQERENDFLLSLKGGALISTFESAEYFSYARALSLEGLYRYAFPRSYLKGGFLLQYDGFTARGINGEARSYLCSMGAVLGWEPRLSERFRLFGEGVFGGSLLLMDDGEEGLRGKIIPFVSGGMGTGLNFSRHWGTVFSVDYTLYLEESVNLSGFSPAFGVGYNF